MHKKSVCKSNLKKKSKIKWEKSVWCEWGGREVNHDNNDDIMMKQINHEEKQMESGKSLGKTEKEARKSAVLWHSNPTNNFTAWTKKKLQIISWLINLK